MEHNPKNMTMTEQPPITEQPQKRQSTPSGASGDPQERKPAARGRGSTKRDEVLDILKNKRKAAALFKRLTLDDNKAIIELLGEVIETQRKEIAAAEAEHQKKLEAATEALMHLHKQGVSDREFVALLDEAKKKISG